MSTEGHQTLLANLTYPKMTRIRQFKPMATKKTAGSKEATVAE